MLLAVLASLAVMGTLALGFVLGKRRLWVHVPLAAGVGTALLAVLYVAAMVAFADPNDSTTDNAAGAGLVIFGVPTALGLAVLLAMPAAVGWLVARRGDRDSELGARR